MSDTKIGIGILGTAAIARKNIRAIKLARNNLGGSSRLYKCILACRCPSGVRCTAPLREYVCYGHVLIR